MENKLNFACDYMEGAHPAILQRMVENNLVKSDVYGSDVFSQSARAKIREACQAPEADVWFLVGGTQANATVLDAILRPYEGVISVNTGHICIHEPAPSSTVATRFFPFPEKTGNSAPMTFKPVSKPG